MPLSNTKAVDQIHLLLQGLTPETTEDVLNEITQIVRDTGREIDNGDAAEEYIILNYTDHHSAWSVTENCWLDRNRATILSDRDLETVEIPVHGFAFPVSQQRTLSDRALSNLGSAFMQLARCEQDGTIHDWRWLSVDEREDNDMRVGVVWASTPDEPTSLAAQYTLPELNMLRGELGQTRVQRPDRDRMREQWGIMVGDRLSRRMAQRKVAIPASRREGSWETGPGFDWRWQNPAFYDDGVLVFQLTGEDDTSITAAREGNAMARSYDDTERAETPEEFRERFPTGDVTWDMYDSAWFVLRRLDADGQETDDEQETHFSLIDAINRAAATMRVRAYHPEPNREDEV